MITVAVLFPTEPRQRPDQRERSNDQELQLPCENATFGDMGRYCGPGSRDHAAQFEGSLFAAQQIRNKH